MAAPDLQFALLPEGKVDRRALAASYGSVLLLLELRRKQRLGEFEHRVGLAE